MNEDVKRKLWGLVAVVFLVGFILFVVWGIGVLRNNNDTKWFMDDDTPVGSGATSSAADPHNTPAA